MREGKDGELRKGRRLSIGRGGMLLLAVAGCLLIGFGLQQPQKSEPEGWVRLDRPLGAAGNVDGGTAKIGAGSGGTAAAGTNGGGGQRDKTGGETGAGDKNVAGGADEGNTSGGKPNAEASNEAGGAGQGIANGGRPDAGTRIDGAKGEGGEGAVTDWAAEAGDGGSERSGYTDNGKLDLNRATAEELDDLPGVGPAKAKAIVEDRERNGPFSSVESVERVKGIGPKMVEKWKNLVVVSHGM